MAHSRLLKMNINEKRKLYKCGDNFKTLDQIKTWPAYYAENKYHLERKVKIKKAKHFPVNENLNSKISVIRDDITCLEIDAIVNHANESLLGGGGVDGAIHRAAGKYLKRECATLNGCKTGKAKITGGYMLPAKYVIHTVGPRGQQPKLLAECYLNSLNCMKENNLRSVAFPCISTGNLGYPNLEAANIALETIRSWLEKDDNGKTVDRIILCLFVPIDVAIYDHCLQVYFPVCESPAVEIDPTEGLNRRRVYGERFLRMKIDEKRKLYKCGDNFKTLDQIKTWPAYYADNKYNLERKVKIKKDKHFPVNENLNSKISVIRDDITCLEIDAIVNHANESLLGGGGVDGAIHRAAGKYLKRECAILNGCQTGQAKITGGYMLPAKYVIHTVGPRGEHPKLLAECYLNSLNCMKENNLRSIAFPCISTGNFGYPNLEAANVALETIRSWLEKDDNGKTVDRIILCLFLQKDVDIYDYCLQVYFPVCESPAVETKKTTEETIRALTEKNNELRQQTTCKICMDKDVTVVFLPCGHFVSCQDCAAALTDCPMCRNPIKGIVRAFMG